MPQVIRMPLVFFPFFLSSLADALVAVGRIQKFLTAEEMAEPYALDYDMKNAVTVDGDFTWETAGKLEDKFETGVQGGGKSGTSGKNSKGKKGGEKTGEKLVLPISVAAVQNKDEQPAEEEKPFELRNLKFNVPRGAFVAIVGRVGSGKVCSVMFSCLDLG
jgi:ABC-type multidrug transport system fused ATPase/permease subunit